MFKEYKYYTKHVYFLEFYMSAQHLLDQNPTSDARKAKKKPDLNRAHISYPNSVRDQLEEIKVETNSSSVSEVIRQAISFYSLAFEEHKKGSDLIIRLKNGEKERLRMFHTVARD